jgi:hypothetical protein
MRAYAARLTATRARNVISSRLTLKLAYTLLSASVKRFLLGLE